MDAPLALPRCPAARIERRPSRRRAVTDADDGDRHPGYRVAQHGPFERIGVGDIELDAGGTLRDAELGVVTLGRLNAARDNAVLLTTWYSGSHLAYLRDYVGPGRAIDPSRHYVVIVDQLGNGFSSSAIDAERAGSPFPSLSIADDVVAQERLLREVLGVERLALALGCSMGAMQVYEWGARFPGRVRRLAAVAGTASPTPWAEVLIRALRRALDRTHGDERALQAHADVWALLGYSSSFWNEAGWRELGFDSADAFVATSFAPLMRSRSVDVLESLLDKWSRAGRYGDGARIPIERIVADTLIVPLASDLIFPPADCARDLERIPGARMAVLDTHHGHLDVLGLSARYRQRLDDALGPFLSG